MCLHTRLDSDNWPARFVHRASIFGFLQFLTAPPLTSVSTMGFLPGRPTETGVWKRENHGMLRLCLASAQGLIHACWKLCEEEIDQLSNEQTLIKSDQLISWNNAENQLDRNWTITIQRGTGTENSASYVFHSAPSHQPRTFFDDVTIGQIIWDW